MKLAFVTPGDSLHTPPWAEEFSSAGHEVTVYAYPPVTMKWPGARVREVKARGPLARGRWLRNAIAHDRPDIVVMHYASTDSFALSGLAVPLVISVWGSDILRDLEGHAMKRALVHTALRRSALVISPAEHMTRRLEAMGVGPDRILTAQYGVDTSALHCERPLRDAPVTVISTRSFAPVYRVSDLIDAAALMDRSLFKRIEVVGSGPLEGALHDLARQNGAGDLVDFLGRIDAHGIANELCNADIYVSTSESDGTSLSLLEAMASGLPCVVSDIAANREWVDEKCGVLFPVGDAPALAAAIDALAADPAARQAMGMVARERVVERGDRARNMTAIRHAIEKLLDAS